MPKQITLENPKVNNLVKRIEAGEVKIPPLQRPFVWEQNQIIDLLESIYKEYPIGSILWWETSETLPAERNIAGFKLPQRPESHPFYYVLDGQQRLSSLYGVFCTDRTVDETEEEEYKVDHSIFDIYFDCDEKKFVSVENKQVGKTYVALKALFDPAKYAEALMAAPSAVRTVISNLYEKFTNYEVPIVVTKKRDFSEVGMIFERVNNTGTRLDLFDLMVAVTWTPDFHLQKEFKGIHEILKKKNFDGIKDKVILQSLSAILLESCRTAVITTLKGQVIRDNIGVLKESLKKAIDYLSTQLKVKSRAVLPHAHQVVPLCYFFSKINTPTAEQVKVINKWFWKTSFSNRYSAGTDKNVDEDISLFKDLVENDNHGCFDSLKYAVTSEQLRNTRLMKSNPFSRAFIVLLANKAPKNLVNGSIVDTGIALSAFNKKEYHHIFPEAFLERKHVDSEKIGTLCNFCLLPADSNKLVSDKAPSDYFQTLVPKSSYKDILESNLLPIKVDIYKKDDYEDFLIERSKKIIDFLDELLV